MTLRVGMLAPIAWRVPPRHYGPWERIVSLLTEGLVERGVDVTLFATADSATSARLSSTAARGWSEDPDGPDTKVAECLHISAVFVRAAEFDLIHNSFDFLPLTYSALVSTPVLTTIHGFSSKAIVPVYEKYNHHGAYVAISEADRHPRLDYVATIHHGIDTDAFALGDAGGGYLLFFGRIHPDKGAAQAIQVARRVGLPLVMAGIVPRTGRPSTPWTGSPPMTPQQPGGISAGPGRSFGLWRSDGSPKPAIAEITRRAGQLRRPPPDESSWLDLGVAEFLADRARHLPRLYRRYCRAELS